MKRGYLRIPALLLLLLLTVSVSWADESVLSLESIIIETFDGEGSATFTNGEPVVWKVEGSQYAADGYPQLAYATGVWPLDLFGSYPENAQELGVLGVRTQFIRQAFNQYDLIPGRGQGDSWEAEGITLPGRVQTIDFWVWGSNYNYSIEIYVIDYRGLEFKLDPISVGPDGRKTANSLKFSGWRNFYVDIPNHIKQAVAYNPALAQMKLTRIVVSTHPEEIVSDNFVYIDHIKVLTDTHESTYDGYELASPERVAEIWGAEE